MRTGSLQEFIKLRRQLTQEKESLAQRLAQINEALGAMPLPSLSAGQGAAGRGSSQTARPGRRAAGSGPSLRELVIEALRESPKTKEEVLSAVQKRGYRFQTKDPLNSLGVILYGRNPKLNRADGRFSLPGGISAPAGTPLAGTGGRRQLSPAARARIAEGQRKRWEAVRKAKQ